MTSADPIERVSVLSTGNVRIRPDHVAATWRPLYWWLFTSRRWSEPRPINVYVIEHRDGLVVFDTGQDRASVTDPDYFPAGPTRLVYDRLAQFDVGPDETLTTQLERLGYSANDVGTAVVSHLHQDHIGGVRELPGAELVISRREWQSLSGPFAEARGLLRRHIDVPGLRWRHIDPEPTLDPALAPFTASYDLFDDGSLVLVPTPGHTPGSLSLLVRRPGRPPLMMVGDLTYDVHLLEQGHVPGVGDRRQARAATALTNQFRRLHPGTVILPAHDPGAATRLAKTNSETSRTTESVSANR